MVPIPAGNGVPAGSFNISAGLRAVRAAGTDYIVTFTVTNSYN